MDFNIAEIVQRVVTFMPAFLLALVVHEYAHAWMAYRWGDETSEWSGRLTLNPVAHMDPFGTVAFPLLSIVMGSSIFFGWAKPVPIDPSRFRNYRKGLFWVAFAGPLSNILLGFATAFALVGFHLLMPADFAVREFGIEFLRGLLMINFALAIFNLIPIPPLDGSNIVMSFLNHNAARKYAEFQQYSFFLLLFLMFSGALRVIGIPIALLAEFSVNLASYVFALALAR
jgi:Zn-dependent protease